MSSQPKIAVVGGGPAGLTIGLSLQRHGIPFTIFELRQKPTEEELAKPSGMLDLHAESGLAVIEEYGLTEEFNKLTGECTDEFIIANRDGDTVFTLPQNGTRPEISRNNLSKLLSGHIPTDNIKWGHRLLSASSSSNSGHDEIELDFATHGKHTFDLVIGADGAWSKTRVLLTDVKPHYSGMQIVTITIKNITSKYPNLANLVRSGSFGAHGNKHAVISQRGPIDSSRIYLWLTVSDENFGTSSGLAGQPAASAKDKLLGDDTLLGTFGPSIKELVATACDEESTDNPKGSLDVRGLYTLPHGTSWNHKPGATLVGDAAHLMLPNGEGVNAAMLDSLLLSQAIIKAYKAAPTNAKTFQSTLDPLLKDFEAALLERAEAGGKDTDMLIGKMFGTDDAASDFAEWLKQAAEQAAVQQ